MTNANNAASDRDVGQEAAAKLFVTNLGTDSTLSAAWSTLLAQINAALQEAQAGPARNQMWSESVVACDNFLVQHGYDTTGAIVLDLLKTPFWEDHLKAERPNADSERFVQALLTDPDVYKAWNALLVQVSTGAQPISAVDAYLAQNGYQCTSIQVTASFVAMRNHNLSYWSGTYNTTITPRSQTVTTEGGPPGATPTTTTLSVPPENGPTLVLLGSNTVTLVGPELSQALNKSTTATSANKLNPGARAQFVYDNGVLTWTAGFSAKVPAAYAGSVTFSEITQPTALPVAPANQFYTPPPSSSYTGPIFSGTLTTTVRGQFDPIHGTPVTVTTYSIAGELAPDLSKANYANNIPGGDAHRSLLDTIGKWFGYLTIGFMIVKYVWSMGRKYVKTTDFQKDSKAFDDVIERTSSEGSALGTELAATTVSPIADMEFSKSDVLGTLDARLQEATTQGEKDAVDAEMKAVTASEGDFDERADDDADVDGDGWGGTLTKLFEEAPK